MYCLTVPATALHHQNSASDWLFFQKRSSKYLHGKYRKKKKKGLPAWYSWEGNISRGDKSLQEESM